MKRPTRRLHWKQNNPRDQIISILNAARGIAGNIAEKRYPTIGPKDKKGRHPVVRVEDAAKELDELLDQIHDLARMLPRGEWPIKLGKKKTYVYTCGRGKVLIKANNIHEAQRLAAKECNSHELAPPKDVFEATPDDIAWVKKRGGYVP